MSRSRLDSAITEMDSIAGDIAAVGRRLDSIGKKDAKGENPKYKIGQSLPSGGSWGKWFGGKPLPYKSAVITDIFEKHGEIHYGIKVVYEGLDPAWLNGTNTLAASEREIR